METGITPERQSSVSKREHGIVLSLQLMINKANSTLFAGLVFGPDVRDSFSRLSTALNETQGVKGSYFTQTFFYNAFGIFGGVANGPPDQDDFLEDSLRRVIAD